jgi:hypothetical protein
MSTERPTARTLTLGLASALLSAVLLNACGGGSSNSGGGGTNPSPSPSLSSVSVNPTSVIGGTAATGTVTLSSAPNSGTAVTLSSNNAAATVPGSVTVNASATSATFNIATSAVAASTPVTISGTLNGTQTAVLTVTPVPPPTFTARFTVKSLTDAMRKGSSGSATTPVPGKGAGSLDTCPLVNVNGSPQLSCEFDGSPSTSPNTITSYRWNWKVGNNQADSQNNSEAKFQPKVSNCGFFAGQSDGGNQQLQMVVTLTITDTANNQTSTTNQNVSVFPAGLCGYAF